MINLTFSPFDLTDVMSYVIVTDMKTGITLKNILMVGNFVT